MALANDILRLEAGVADRLGEIMRRIRERMEKRRKYRQTVDELRTLSSRELNDLGIHESMIERIAYEAAYGK